MEETKRVVVVGGGVAGAHVVRALQLVAAVTLIDPKDYFEIPWALLRCMVEPSFAERSVFNHSDYMVNGRLVTSSAVSATDTHVVTASGESIRYDYLVIGTGRKFEGPSTKQERLKQFEAEHEKIKTAQTILIIGGGPTGVELAGEIKVDFPDKKVIIVHAGDRLIDFLGQKASRKALDWLISKKVEVHLNERIDLENLSESNTNYTTSSGVIISADCHFMCVGNRVASSWLQESVFKNCVDKEGHLKVDDCLRLRGKSNVFAVGDIVDVKVGWMEGISNQDKLSIYIYIFADPLHPTGMEKRQSLTLLHARWMERISHRDKEIKQGFIAEKHAAVVAGNIKKLMLNSKHKLTTYKAASTMGIVSLGRRVAVAQLPFAGTTIGCIPGRIKSKDLFVGRTRKGLGLAS